MLMLRLFAWWFRLKGWKTGEPIPAHIKKCVVIAAPHTSNWDFVYSLATAQIMGLKVGYLAKKELFRFPLRGLLLRTGGIPVIRSHNTNLVTTIIELFNEKEELKLMIPAEGTRKRVQKWKSGFYHVALGAGVPVFMGYLDYKNKKAGYGPQLILSGDKKKDAAIIREFYSDKTAKHPELFNLDAIRFD
jgi:1-acyl-sn-glycerol-3-phosphate acyltransferase